MTLPNTKQIVLGTGTEIPSTLLNNIQDMIVGGRHGSVTKNVPYSAWRGLNASIFDQVTVISTSANEHTAWFGMRPLDVIEDIQVGCRDDTGVSEVLRFQQVSKIINGISKLIEGTIVESDNSGALQIVVLPANNFPFTILANRGAGLEVTPQASFTWLLGDIEVTFSH